MSTAAALLRHHLGDRPHREVERVAGLAGGTLSRAARGRYRIDPCKPAFRRLCAALSLTVAQRCELAVAYGLDPVVAYGESARRENPNRDAELLAVLHILDAPLTHRERMAGIGGPWQESQRSASERVGLLRAALLAAEAGGGPPEPYTPPVTP